MKQIYLIATMSVLAILCIIFALDRFRLNQEFNDIGSKIDEKGRFFAESEAKYQKQLKEQDQKISELERRFQFVTEIRETTVDSGKKQPEKADKENAATLEKQSGFAQISKDQSVLDAARYLAKQVQPPITPDSIQQAFLKYLNDPDRPPQKLEIDPVSNRVIDRDAAVLETLCRMFRLNARTTIRWDMSRLTRSCLTVIESPFSDVPPAIVVYRGSPAPGAATVTQSAPLSVILPLDTVILDQEAPRDILLKLHELPVGGLYVHRIDFLLRGAAKSQTWVLHYALPRQTQPDQPPHRLQAVSLLPGKPVVSAAADNHRMFTVTFADGKASLLIFGDSVLLPESVSISPLVHGHILPQPDSAAKK